MRLHLPYCVVLGLLLLLLLLALHGLPEPRLNLSSSPHEPVSPYLLRPMVWRVLPRRKATVSALLSILHFPTHYPADPSAPKGPTHYRQIAAPPRPTSHSPRWTFSKKGLYSAHGRRNGETPAVAQRLLQHWEKGLPLRVWLQRTGLRSGTAA